MWHIYFVNESMKISDVKTNKWQNDAVQITTFILTKKATFACLHHYNERVNYFRAMFTCQHKLLALQLLHGSRPQPLPILHDCGDCVERLDAVELGPADHPQVHEFKEQRHLSEVVARQQDVGRQQEVTCVNAALTQFWLR